MAQAKEKTVAQSLMEELREITGESTFDGIIESSSYSKDFRIKKLLFNARNELKTNRNASEEVNAVAGVCAGILGYFEEAKTQFQSLWTRNQNNFHYLINYLESLLNLEQIDKANEVISQMRGRVQWTTGHSIVLAHKLARGLDPMSLYTAFRQDEITADSLRQFTEQIIEGAIERFRNPPPKNFTERVAQELKKALESGAFEKNLFRSWKFIMLMTGLLGLVSEEKQLEFFNILTDITFSEEFHDLCGVEVIEGGEELKQALEFHE